MLAGKLFANFFVCRGEEYMKKLVCAIMALFILLSFSACDAGTKESRPVSNDAMKKDGDTTSETTETEPSETTTKPSIQAPKNDTFDDFEIVVGKVFNSLGDEVENLIYQSADAALKNKDYGIINMAHIWSNEIDISSNDDNEPAKFILVEVFVFEFDTETEQYKNLKVGDDFKFDKDNYLNDHFPTVITAINNQYVISFYAIERLDNLLVSKAESLPEFTLGNMQKAYDTFVKINTEKKTTDTKPDDPDAFQKFDDLCNKVWSSLGEDYLNFVYQDGINGKKNKDIGIRNMVHIWRSESDLENDLIVLWEFTVDVFIFEFDTESDEYKDLKVGEKVFFYERECMNSEIITAINGKYVLCIHAQRIDYKEKKEIVEIAPEFKLGNAQNGYETFIKHKVEE